MKRVIVLGGLGLFGRTAAEQLRDLGIPVTIASRRALADIQVDANDANSIRASVRKGDLVIDAAGPFHQRSTALLEAAAEIGFDIIDINDDLDYAQSALAMMNRFDCAGIRVLSSASSVSVVSACVVRRSGIPSPVRFRGFIVPASRHTANPGSALSLLRSIGRPVRVLRGGELQSMRGWSETRRLVMPAPIGRVCGRLFESADAIHLPRDWPSLREVATYVDTNTLGFNTALGFAARFPLVRQLMKSQVRLGTWVAKKLGSDAGGLGFEIEGGSGRVARYAVVSESSGFVTAVAPAVLAACSIVRGDFLGRGLISPQRQVDSDELLEFLDARGIRVVELS